LVLGGWILLAVDAVLLVASILGHERAADALASQLGGRSMPEDPGIARSIATWTDYLGSLGLAAQTAAVWLAMRWRRWRLEPAGAARSHVAMAVLVVALLWSLGNAAGVVFEVGAGGAEAEASLRDSVLGWRALVDLGNAGALVAAWKWRPWRKASATPPVA
jgi:hypothetical protein